MTEEKKKRKAIHLTEKDLKLLNLIKDRYPFLSTDTSVVRYAFVVVHKTGYPDFTKKKSLEELKERQEEIDQMEEDFLRKLK